MAISNPPPPGFMRMGNGRIVPTSAPFGSAKKVNKRFLVVLQYYEGDRETAIEQATLIADMERTRNHEADIMLMHRADARPMEDGLKAKLANKFDKVLEHRCRRTDAKSYPFGANQMFSDLVMLMHEKQNDYYAFINLETDVVPVHPGWIGELTEAWKKAQAAGKHAIGHVNGPKDPTRQHMNGVAVYSTSLWSIVGGKKLAGSNPQIAYDIFHADEILPLAADTPLIAFQFKRPTITPEQLFTAHKGGIEPAIYHGVKDGTARAAVRARYVTFTERRKPVSTHPDYDGKAANKDLADFTRDKLLEASGVTLTPPERRNVYTYSHKSDAVNAKELAAILDAWRRGWTSRGWNPVILTMRDAAKHLLYEKFSDAVAKFPCATDRKRVTHAFLRWLALDSAGGGLLTDYDVLPGEFTPGSVTGGEVMRDPDTKKLIAANLTKAEAGTMIQRIMAYDAQPTDVLYGTDKPHVTDSAVVSVDTVGLDIRHFGVNVVGNERKSVAMEKSLAEVPVS